MKRKKRVLPLNKKGDFTRVFEQGRKLSSRYLVIFAKPNGLAYSRLGLSVGKKIGHAVTRNRIRRRLRESFRSQIADRSLHYDIVIVARKSSVNAGFSDFNSIIDTFMSGLTHENTLDNTHKNI